MISIIITCIICYIIYYYYTIHLQDEMIKLKNKYYILKNKNNILNKKYLDTLQYNEDIIRVLTKRIK